MITSMHLYYNLITTVVHFYNSHFILIEQVYSLLGGGGILQKLSIEARLCNLSPPQQREQTYPSIKSFCGIITQHH